MLGGGGIAPVTCCSTVSITNSRCDLSAGAGSRVEHDYTLIGASLSEPHTSESNGGIFIYIYIIYISVVHHSVNAS